VSTVNIYKIRIFILTAAWNN